MMLFITPDQLAMITAFVIELIVATIAFFFAGRLLSGVNAKSTDAFFVAFLGLFLKFVLDFGISLVLVPGLNEFVIFAWNVVALLAMFIVWMVLVQHFFDTFFVRGLTIVIIAFVLIFIIDFVIEFLFVLLFPGP